MRDKRNFQIIEIQTRPVETHMMNGIGELLRFQAECRMLQIMHLVLANDSVRFIFTLHLTLLLAGDVDLLQLCGENTVDFVVVFIHEQCRVDLRREREIGIPQNNKMFFCDKEIILSHIAARIGQEVCGVELNARLIAVNFQISS